MIDRPMDVWGAPLEVEVLLHGCLKSCINLMELSRADHVSRLIRSKTYSYKSMG